MEQNTTDWLKFRKDKLGASDTPIILGVSPYKTPYELWLEKTNRVDVNQETNYAIEAGNRLEPQARARFELKYDLDFKPVVLVSKSHEYMMASLDGWNEESRAVLEIKIPGKDVFNLAKKNLVHEKYYPQVQSQLFVSQGLECHFFCCHYEKSKDAMKIVDDALAIVKPDLSYLDQLLLPKVEEFWKFIQNDIPPPLMDRDCLFIEDEKTVEIFAALKRAKLEMAQYELLEEQQKLKAKELESLFEKLKLDAIDHCEKSIGHIRVESVGTRVAKNKNGKWVVTLK